MYYIISRHNKGANKMAIKEILVTLFNNEDGMTLSVTPNYNYGGKRVNFSYKGKGTHCNMKSYVDGINGIKNPQLRNFFEEDKQQWRKKVKGCIDAGLDCWLSKGYLSDGKLGKGHTVPATAFMVKGKGYYTLQLQLGKDYYECDLETDAITDRQREQNAIAGHRWQYKEETLEYDLGFMGCTD